MYRWKAGQKETLGENHPYLKFRVTFQGWMEELAWGNMSTTIHSRTLTGQRAFMKSLKFTSTRGLVVWDETKNKSRSQAFKEP